MPLTIAAAFRRILNQPITLLACVAAMTLTTVAVSIAAPEPDPVPRRWQLDINPGPLRVAMVNDGERGPLAYFYFVFDVENNSGADRYFAPRFELVTDKGHILRSGRNVPRAVTEEIRSRLRDPLLEDQLQVQGTLLQGPENAKRGLVIWPVPTLDADEVSLYATGFSGETTMVELPDTGERVLMRKTLMLRHTIPGTLDVYSDKPLTRSVNRWIMR